MPFSLAIVGLVVLWTWWLERRLPEAAVAVIVAAILVLAIWHNARRGEWGLDWRAFVPGIGRALMVTAVGAALILAAGMALDTLHDRRDALGSLGPLILWGAAQQWILQTVLLREAQRVSSRRGGMFVAAALFGALHLPNPFLAPLTSVAALFWCRIYDRFPNVIPVGLSHAVGTLAILYAFDADITGRLRVGMSYLAL